MTAATSILGLGKPLGGIDPQIRAACTEVILAAKDAGHDLPAVSWFNPDSKPEHHVPGMAGQKGVANDFMVYKDRAMGDFIADYLWANRERLGVCWIIWRDRIRSTTPGKSGEWEPRGKGDHYDHVHANLGKLVGTNGSSKVTKIAYVPPSSTKPSVVLGTVWVDRLVKGVVNSVSIRLVQRALEVEQTGTYDEATIAAAKKYQASLGDDVDGWLGPKQVTRLFADKNMSVTVRLDPSGEAPAKPPVVVPPPKPVDPKPAGPKPDPITISLKAWNDNPAGRTLIQGVEWDAANGCYFVHQADDVAGSSQQTVVIRRHKGDGTYVGFATVPDAGHGSSVGCDFFKGGARLWLGHATQGSGFLTYNIGSSDTPFKRTPAIPKGDISVDVAADLLCVRDGNRYRGYRLSDARDNKAAKVFEFKVPTWLARFQGHTIAKDRVFIHRDAKTKGASEIRSYDLRGKLLRKWDTSDWGDEAEGAMVKDGWVFSVSRVGNATPSRKILCTPIEEY